MRSNNIVLTGLPRSGTTLTCHLLNKLPNTVALHEPIEFWEILKFKTHQDICFYIAEQFESMRDSILIDKTAISRQIQGRIPDNNFGDDKHLDSGLRKNLVSIGTVDINKQLEPNFLLVIKEPGIFTAILKNLVEQFPTFAIIRNPLAVLASWNTVPFHVTKGRTPVARLDSALAQGLAQIKDRIDRQIYILSWFYEQYRIFLPDSSILRYETIIASGGKALSVIQSQIQMVQYSLKNKNLNPLYDREMMLLLGDKLLNSEGAFWNFYSRESVEILLKECEKSNS
jgi:hypothetical protein